MRFLLDHDVYAITARYLMTLGHDVQTVAQLGLAEADDEELLAAAREQDRLLVTRDRDFGNLVFVRALGQGAYTCEYSRQLEFRFIKNLHECLPFILRRI
jgi:uncharacterized protein with PIN domain